MKRRNNKDFESCGHSSRPFLILFFRIIAFSQSELQIHVTATVTVGSNPEGVAVTPNGNYAYVTNEGGTTVSVIKHGYK